MSHLPSTRDLLTRLIRGVERVARGVKHLVDLEPAAIRFFAEQDARLKQIEAAVTQVPRDDSLVVVIVVGAPTEQPLLTRRN